MSSKLLIIFLLYASNSFYFVSKSYILSWSYSIIKYFSMNVQFLKFIKLKKIKKFKFLYYYISVEKMLIFIFNSHLSFLQLISNLNYSEKKKIYKKWK